MEEASHSRERGAATCHRLPARKVLRSELIQLPGMLPWESGMCEASSVFTHFSPTLPSAFRTLHVPPWSLLGVPSSLCPVPLLSCIPVSFLSAPQAASVSSALTLVEKVS